MLLSKLADSRRASSLLIVVTVLTPVVLGLALYGLTAGGVRFGVAPGDQLLIPGLLAIVGLVALLGWIGIRPRHTVAIEGTTLTIAPPPGRQLKTASTVYEVRSISEISAREYHAHFSRYRNVVRYGRVTSRATLLMFVTSEQRIVLSVSSDTANRILQNHPTRDSSDLIAA
ncbi:MAG: hypothetical protein HKN13_01540 [Rhodothermales bacterium]|nr:hypothetical protein [Rhodothermales bacterium]